MCSPLCVCCAHAVATTIVLAPTSRPTSAPSTRESHAVGLRHECLPVVASHAATIAALPGATVPRVAANVAASGVSEAKSDWDFILESLDSGFKILRAVGRKKNSLPIAATCDRRLELPTYKTYAQLERNMNMALEWGLNGFTET